MHRMYVNSWKFVTLYLAMKKHWVFLGRSKSCNQKDHFKTNFTGPEAFSVGPMRGTGCRWCFTCSASCLPHLLCCTQGRQLVPPFTDVLPPSQYISRWGGSGCIGTSPCYSLQLTLCGCLAPWTVPPPQPIARSLCLLCQLLDGPLQSCACRSSGMEKLDRRPAHKAPAPNFHRVDGHSPSVCLSCFYLRPADSGIWHKWQKYRKCG